MRSYDIIIFALAVVGAVIAYSAGYVAKKKTDDENEITKLKIRIKFAGLAFVAAAVILIMIDQLL